MKGDRHALKRTSPKGGAFVGTCLKCGLDGLTLDDMAKQQCVNPGGLNNSDTLKIALRGSNS